MSGIIVTPRNVGLEPAWMRLVRVASKSRLLWLQHFWSTFGDPVDPHRECTVLLENPEVLRQLEREFRTSDPAAVALGHEWAAAEKALQMDSVWANLVSHFKLEEKESQLLALCAAAEQDPDLRRVFGYLLDQRAPADPSIWLASELFGWDAPLRLHPDMPLCRWRLANPVEGQTQPWSYSAAWAIDASVVDYLLGDRRIDPEVSIALQCVRPFDLSGWPCLYPDVLAQVMKFLEDAMTQPALRYEIELSAPSGAGKRILAAQVAISMGRELVVVDCARLLPPNLTIEQVFDRVSRAVRAATLLGCVPCWHGAENFTATAWAALQPFSGVHFFSTHASIQSLPESGVIRRRFQLPPLDRAQRSEFWTLLTGSEPLPQIERWALLPSEIVGAAQISGAGTASALEVLRQRIQQEPGELFSIISSSYSWDDLVLNPAIEGHLRDFEFQARNREIIYDEWGFGCHSAMGRGISAMFAGPSGTGKTMAAQVLAASLDLQLFKVDLAGLFNKYVGETEKRIRSVFDRCRRSNVMLFFDEADSIFSHRVQTRDAHDRFANVEVDYLLQQMEQFEGICVLATNRKAELDTAFVRRLRFIVDFLPPGPAERLRLWKRALIERSPAGVELLDHIDWDYLATKLTLTGADIKNAAISAAFLAQRDGTRIGMKHVISAVKRELTKQGIVLRAGDWSEAEWQN